MASVVMKRLSALCSVGTVLIFRHGSTSLPGTF